MFSECFLIYFQIEIEDVNEAPIGIGIYGGGLLKENSAEGTIIGDINTRDQEKNQIYTDTLDAIYPGSDNCLVHVQSNLVILSIIGPRFEILIDVFQYWEFNWHLEYMYLH